MALKRHKRVNRIVADNFTRESELGENAVDGYANGIFDNYNRDFNSLGYKEITIINTSTATTHDSSHYAYEVEAGLPSRRKNKFFVNTSFAPQGQFDYNHDASHPVKGIFIHQDSTPGYVGRANWIYGDAIRIYTDGTGAGVRFLDSDTFRGGATEAQMIEDSTWSDFGGIIALTTDSHPDNAFTNATWDSSPGWSTHSYLLVNTGDRNYFGNSNYVDFKIAQNIVPYEYDSSDILYSQAAFDSASGSGGGGADQAELDSANQLIELLRSNLDSANVDALDSANQLITLLRSNLDSAGDPEGWS